MPSCRLHNTAVMNAISNLAWLIETINTWALLPQSMDSMNSCLSSLRSDFACTCCMCMFVFTCLAAYFCLYQFASIYGHECTMTLLYIIISVPFLDCVCT